VRFHPWHRRFEDVHVEHGHNYDRLTRYNPESCWMAPSDGGERVLDLSAEGFIIHELLNRILSRRPVAHRIKPAARYMAWSFRHDFACTVKSFLDLIAFPLRVRFRSEPAVRKRILECFNRPWMMALNRRLLGVMARLIIDTERVRTVIFGHTHKAEHLVFPGGGRYINTGTWTNILRMDRGGFQLQGTLPYALIRINPGRPSEASLLSWNGAPA